MTSRRDVDGGWAWLVLLASYVTLLMCSGLCFIAGVFQVLFLEEFQGSVAYTSWVTALFSSLMQLAGPLSALLTNWANCRVSVMVGGACLSLGLAASSQAGDLTYLFVTFGTVAGLGLGLCYSAAIIVINFFFDTHRTMVTGIALSASGLGILLAPQISKILFDFFSWRESLVMLAAGSAQICVVGALMFPINERKNRRQDCASQSCKYRCFCSHSEPNLSPEYESGHPLHNAEIIVEEIDTELNSLVRDVEHTPCSHDLGGHNKAKGHTTLSTDSENDPLEYGGNPILSHSGNSMKSDSTDHNYQAMNSKDVPEDSPLQPGHSLTEISQSNNIGDVQENSVMDSHTDKQHHLQIHSLISHHLRNHILDTGTVTDKCRSHGDLSYGESVQRGHGILQSHQELHHLHADTAHSASHSSSLHLTVVSRQPSLVHLVPSTHHLDIIVSQDHLKGGTTYHSQSLSQHSGANAQTREMTFAPVGKHTSLLSVTSLATYKVTSPISLPPLHKNLGFWIICAQLFIANAGCGIFNIHLPSFALSKGLTAEEVTNILSFNGAGILASRCFVGALANATHSDLLLYWALHILGGVFVMLIPALGVDYPSLSCLILGCAMYYGSVYSVLTSITISCVGLRDLATAFGLEMVCSGLGYFLAPPIAGLLVDLTGSYDYDMYCGGALFILSSLVLLWLPMYQRTRNILSTSGRDMDEEENKDSNTKTG